MLDRPQSLDEMRERLDLAGAAIASSAYASIMGMAGTGTAIPPMAITTDIRPMAMATPRPIATAIRLTATAIRLTTAATLGRTTAPMPTRVLGRCGGSSSIAPAGADDGSADETTEACTYMCRW